MKIKKIIPIFIVFGAGIFASLPLFRLGFLPTHDGEYHIIRFFEFEKMLRNGILFPRWAPGLNSDYGIPLFNFFYPFPNYAGNLFHSLGWSLPDAFKLSLATGYIAAGVFCFLWLRKFFHPIAAITGTIVFSYVPYWFVSLYVRGSIGEIFAISFLMLTLTAIEWRWGKIVSIGIAGIIVSHNILSIFFLPIVTVYLFIRNKGYIQTIVVGIGLSSYFWLPALAERNFVVGLNVVNFKDYFPQLYQLLVPSWGTDFSGTSTGNEMSPQIGLVPLVVIFLSIFSILKNKGGEIERLAKYFFVLVILSFFLMQEISLPLWRLIPVLSFLQYPWRLLSVFLPVVAFLAAYLSFQIKNMWFSVILIFAAVFLSYSYTRPVTYAPRSDEYYLTRPNFTDGTSSLGNSFSTHWSDWKKERAKEKIEIINGSAQVSNVETKPTDYRFSVLAGTASTIAVNTLYYPGWIVQVDSISVSIDYEKDGTIKFLVPSGNHVVRVYFGETPLRILADFISLLSLFWIIRSAILEKVYEHRNRYHANAQRT